MFILLQLMSLYAAFPFKLFIRWNLLVICMGKLKIIILGTVNK